MVRNQRGSHRNRQNTKRMPQLRAILCKFGVRTPALLLYFLDLPKLFEPRKDIRAH